MLFLKIYVLINTQGKRQTLQLKSLAITLAGFPACSLPMACSLCCGFKRGIALVSKLILTIIDLFDVVEHSWDALCSNNFEWLNAHDCRASMIVSISFDTKAMPRLNPQQREQAIGS
jgi:hypothetical protein